MAGLRARGETVLGLRKRELDITDAGAVTTLIADYRPGIVINCAAWTAVDAAEAQEEPALAVNGRGAGEPGRRLRAGRRGDGADLHGLRVRRPGQQAVRRDRRARAADRVRPHQAGRRASRAQPAARRRASDQDGLALRARRPEFRAHDDQAGRRPGLPSTWWPTSTASQAGPRDVAEQVITLAAAGARGIYHATSAGQTTWFELARHVFELLGHRPGAGAPDDQRGLPPPGAAPRLERARSRPLPRPAGRADRRLAAGPAASLADAVGVLGKGKRADEFPAPGVVRKHQARAGGRKRRRGLVFVGKYRRGVNRPLDSDLPHPKDARHFPVADRRKSSIGRKLWRRRSARQRRVLVPRR